MIAGTAPTQPKYKKIGEEEDERFVKHQSFENYLVEIKKKCRDKHLP